VGTTLVVIHMHLESYQFSPYGAHSNTRILLFYSLNTSCITYKLLQLHRCPGPMWYTRVLCLLGICRLLLVLGYHMNFNRSRLIMWLHILC